MMDVLIRYYYHYYHVSSILYYCYYYQGLRDGHGMEVYNGVTINGVWSKGKLIHTTQEDNDGDGAEQQHIEAISIITIKIPDIVINGQLSDTFPPPIPLIPE